MTTSVRILTTSKLDSSPSLLFVSPNGSKILVNCGEGCQRSFLESNSLSGNNVAGLRVRSINRICLTHIGYDAVGGLPGMILTTADAAEAALNNINGDIGGDKKSRNNKNHNNNRKRKLSKEEEQNLPGLELMGPNGTEGFIKSLSHFMRRDRFKIRINEGDFKTNMNDISNSKRGVSKKQQRKKQKNRNNRNNHSNGVDERNPHCNMVEGFIVQSIPLTWNVSLPAAAVGYNRRKNGNATDTSRLEKHLLSYIFTTPPVQGKFLIDKAKELQIPPGRLYGILKSGKSVTFKVGDEERTVKSEEVVTEGSPGISIVVIYCPHLSILDQLQSSTVLNDLKVDNNNCDNKEEEDTISQETSPNKKDKNEQCELFAMIHITPSSVFQSESYQNWMKDFGTTTDHMTLYPVEDLSEESEFRSEAEDNDGTIFHAAAMGAMTRSLLSEEVFPSPFIVNSKYNKYNKMQSTETEDASIEKYDEPEINGVEKVISKSDANDNPLKVDKIKDTNDEEPTVTSESDSKDQKDVCLDKVEIVKNDDDDKVVEKSVTENYSFQDNERNDTKNQEVTNDPQPSESVSKEMDVTLDNREEVENNDNDKVLTKNIIEDHTLQVDKMEDNDDSEPPKSESMPTSLDDSHTKEDHVENKNDNQIKEFDENDKVNKIAINIETGNELSPVPTNEEVKPYVGSIISARPLMEYVLIPRVKRGLNKATIPASNDKGISPEDHTSIFKKATKSGAILCARKKTEELNPTDSKVEEEKASDFIPLNDTEQIDHKDEPGELVFTGTGSALPCKHRNVTGMYLQFKNGNGMLLDVGEGTVGQLLRSWESTAPENIQGNNVSIRNYFREKICSIKAIWVSHPHADHHLGVLRFLTERTRIVERHDDPVVLMAPQNMFRFLDEYIDVDPTIARSYIALDCRDMMHGKVNPLGRRLHKELGLTWCAAVPVMHCPHSFAIIIDGTPFGRLAYSGDCRPSDRFATVAKGTDLLIHEATFEDGMEEEAVLKRHSTVGEALEVGNKMMAKAILLTHFSQRYPKIPPLPQSPGQKKDANTENDVTTKSDGESPQEDERPVAFAFDFMRIRPSTIKLASSLTPALRLLYPEDVKIDENDNMDTIDDNASSSLSAKEILSVPGMFATKGIL